MRKSPVFARKTAKNPEKLTVFQGFCSGQHFYPLNMVYPTGVEPATLGVGVLRSIQLSYGYISLIYYTKIFRKSKEFLHIPEKFSV